MGDCIVTSDSLAANASTVQNVLTEDRIEKAYNV